MDLELDVRLQRGWFGKLSRRRVSAHTELWCSQFVVPMKTKFSNSGSSPYALFLCLASGWIGVAYLESARLPSLSLQYNKQVVSACGSWAHLLLYCLSKYRWAFDTCCQSSYLMSHLWAADGAGRFIFSSPLQTCSCLEDEFCSHRSVFLSCQNPICLWMGAMPACKLVSAAESVVTGNCRNGGLGIFCCLFVFESIFP